MVEQTAFLHHFLVLALCLMMCVVFVCMVRAIKGPRVADRVVALNMIGTLVVMMICIVSYVLEESFLVDVALLYALLNMLVVVVLTRLASRHHQEVRTEEQEDTE